MCVCVLFSMNGEKRVKSAKEKRATGRKRGRALTERGEERERRGSHPHSLCFHYANFKDRYNAFRFIHLEGGRVGGGRAQTRDPAAPFAPLQPGARAPPTNSSASQIWLVIKG